MEPEPNPPEPSPPEVVHMNPGGKKLVFMGRPASDSEEDVRAFVEQAFAAIQKGIAESAE